MSNNGGYEFYFGGGLWTLLFIIMFVMKVLGIGAVATWSWWWVTAPLWGPIALSLLIVIGFLVTSFVIALIAYVTEKRN